MKKSKAMSELELQEMQQKIDDGLLLAQKRLIAQKKKDNGELVIVYEGEIMQVKARNIKNQNS